METDEVEARLAGHDAALVDRFAVSTVNGDGRSIHERPDGSRCTR